MPGWSSSASLYASLLPSAADVTEAVAILGRTGAREYTRTQARRYRDEALAELDAAGVVRPEARAELERIIVGVISRLIAGRLGELATRRLGRELERRVLGRVAGGQAFLGEGLLHERLFGSRSTAQVAPDHVPVPDRQIPVAPAQAARAAGVRQPRNAQLVGDAVRPAGIRAADAATVPRARARRPWPSPRCRAARRRRPPDGGGRSPPAEALVNRRTGTAASPGPA